MAFFAPDFLNITNEQELLDIVQEVQFENPDIKRLENLFGDVRRKYEYNQGKVNTDSNIREIASIMERVFGFYSFQLTIDHSKIPNAYTVPMSSKIDSWNYKKCVVRDNKGLRFTAAAKVNVMAVITSGLLFNDSFTDREIVAVLLHEIGHNFSDSINNTLGIFSNFKKVLMIPAVFTNPHHVLNTGRGLATKFNKNMRENYADLVDTFNAVKMFIGSVNYVIININRFLSLMPQVAASNMVNIFKNLGYQLLRNPAGVVLNTVFNFFGKEDEYVSDSFVAMYGYGADLSSALLKLDRTHITAVDELMKSSEVGAYYFAFMVESVDFIGQLLSDNHPATAKRLLNVLDTLEKEYSRDYINPKFKKETKKEIEEIKKLIEQEMETEEFSGNFWRVKWNKYILSSKSNKSPKEKMLEEMLDKIESLEEE